MNTSEAQAAQIVQENVGLAHWGARRFLWTRIPLEDLVQCALIGLYNAAFKYDPSRGARFSTIAHWYMLQQLHIEAAKMRSIISVPIKESKLGVTEHVSSMDYSKQDGEWGEGASRIVDVETSNKVEHDGVSRDVGISLEVLSVRERFVVTHQHGLAEAEHPHSLEALGEIMGVSRERVRQIEQRANSKLRHGLRDYAEGYEERPADPG